MSQLEEYFKKNSFTFGEDNSPDIKPGPILTVLKLGLQNFYESFYADIDSGMKSYIYEVIPNEDEERAIIQPVIGCSHQFLTKYFTALTYTQHFFELYITSMLDNISLALTRKQKEIKNVNQLLDTIKNEKNSTFTNKRTKGYKCILNRFKLLLEHHNEIPVQFRIPEEYCFFYDHIHTLFLLSIWRDKIIHSGKQVLYHYAFELLFINLIIPITKEIVKIEDYTVTLNRNLHCGLNVIDELSKIKLPYNYEDPKKIDEISTILNKINHLKELGRASFNNPLFMEEFGSKELRKNLRNENMRKRLPVEKEADIAQEFLDYYQRFNCPCCGTYSLMTFEYWMSTENQQTRPFKAKCILCTYTISKFIGEPKDHGIMDENIFNYVD